MFCPTGWRTHLKRLRRLDARAAVRYVMTRTRRLPGLGWHMLSDFVSSLGCRAADAVRAVVGRREPAADTAAGPVSTYLQLTAASLQLLARYRPGNFDGRLVLFRAANDYDPRPMWAGRIDGGVQTHDMPGGHLDMLEEPIVSTTAALLREHLELADREQSSTAQSATAA